MSDTLQDKLRAILYDDYDHSPDWTHDGQVGEDEAMKNLDHTVARILQAFTEAGWHSPDKFARLVETLSNNYGQMYYDRFKAQLEKDAMLYQDNADYYIEAARIASGLTDGETQ